jgi:PIN domain nuclease of toxin-antitoxin system
MRILIDTHTLLWFVWNHPNLSATALNHIVNPGNVLLLSTGTIWEMAIKVNIGKLTLASPFDVFVNQAIATSRLTVLPITVAHAAALTSLPLHHRDPFDRLLVAQALTENVHLLSADGVFDAYPIARLW